MTGPDSLPRVVQEWLPGARVVGRPRDEAWATVLHLRDARGRQWFAKRVPRRKFFTTEVRAYQQWGHLDCVPDLVATHRRTRSLLVTGLPGTEPRDRPRTLRRAGSLLRLLHGVEPLDSWTGDWREQVRAEASRHLVQVQSRAVGISSGQVRRSVEEMTNLDGLPLAVGHGDFRPSNWRGRRGRMGTFDFSDAGLRPAVHDFTRVAYTAGGGRTDQVEAMVQGYGRALTKAERRYLCLSMVPRSVIAMNLGFRWGRPDMIAHALAVLRRHPG